MLQQEQASQRGEQKAGARTAGLVMASALRHFVNTLPDYPLPAHTGAGSSGGGAAAAPPPALLPQAQLLALFGDAVRAVEGYKTRDASLYTGEAG